MKRINIITGLGLICALLGLAFMIPALFHALNYGTMPGKAVAPYTLGVVLAVLGGNIVFNAIRRRKA